MSFVSVTDAWMTELTTNVTGLQVATVPLENRHPYASWSLELLATQAKGRHVAVFPNADAEGAEGWVTAPTDLDTARYTVLVWEDASGDAARLQDDDTANAAWLALYEAIKARFRVQANTSGATALGGAGIAVRYRGGTFDMRSSVRVIAIYFETMVAGVYT